jgi:hypothetical protein
VPHHQGVSDLNPAVAVFCISWHSDFLYVTKMNRLSASVRQYDTHAARKGAGTTLPTLLFILLLITSCGGKEKEIPPEEKGEPNVLPEEIVLYREAREAFREWTTLFETTRSFDLPYSRLSRTSLNTLRRDGVVDAASFGRWFTERSNAGLPPFSYTFSRFDILDIEMRDTNEALLTGTFLVEIHASTFESVGTFRLRRQGGRWVLPFAESGDFESSWWQKERQFSTRVIEEGTSTYFARPLDLSFRHPITWDVTARSAVQIPGYSASLPGVELTYVDPSTLLPQAIVRIAVSNVALPDSVLATEEAVDPSLPVFVRREAVSVAQPAPMSGKLTTLADAMNGRTLYILAVVDENSNFQFFAKTFDSIISSILSSKVNTQ